MGAKITPIFSSSSSKDKNKDDEWEEERKKFEANYDPDKIFVYSSDKKGHGEPLAVRLTPWVNADIGMVVDAKVGYKRKSDFVRDAIHHRLQFWACRLKDKKFRLRVFQQQIFEWIMLHNDMTINMEAGIESFKQRVLKFNLNKDVEGLQDYLDEFKEMVNKCEDKTYKKRLIKSLNDITFQIMGQPGKDTFSED